MEKLLAWLIISIDVLRLPSELDVTQGNATSNRSHQEHIGNGIILLYRK